MKGRDGEKGEGKRWGGGDAKLDVYKYYSYKVLCRSCVLHNIHVSVPMASFCRDTHKLSV